MYDDNARLAVLRAKARMQLSLIDVLLVPTVLEHFLVEEIQEQEHSTTPVWHRNAKNGRFTNFVNLLDMCGISVPSGLLTVDYSADAGATAESRTARLLSSGGPMQVALPFGVTLLAAAWKDEWLWHIAARMHELSGLGCGPQGHGVPAVTPNPGHDAI